METMMFATLVSVVNLSFDNGIVHGNWKNARVTPVDKNEGEIDDENNFRSISVMRHTCIGLLMTGSSRFPLFSYILLYILNHDVCTLLSRFCTKGFFVSYFKIIYQIFCGMTFIFCWYETRLFVKCDVIFMF